MGSIIIAAVVTLFKQLKDLPHYWRLDKLDFVIISFYILNKGIFFPMTSLAIVFLSLTKYAPRFVTKKWKDRSYTIHVSFMILDHMRKKPFAIESKRFVTVILWFLKREREFANVTDRLSRTI